MFCPVKLILISVSLNCCWGLSDVVVSSPVLTVRVGDSALMGCVFQTTEEKPVTKVDWTFSSGENAKDEYVLYYYANLSVPVGRFQNRVRLAGDILNKDGSLLLQEVQKADQGTYNCEIRLERESTVFKKTVTLHVLPEEPKELTVQVGDSIRMGCVFQSTEEKLVTQVDWTFSSRERAQVCDERTFFVLKEVSGDLVLVDSGNQSEGWFCRALCNTEQQLTRQEETVFRYYHKHNMPMGHSQSSGRFWNRVNLVGDISHHDGSIVLQEVKASDGGNYTCCVHLGSLVFRKTVVLSVTREEARTLVVPGTDRPEVLSGNQLLILVGIVCTTILLLTVLILIVKKIHCSKSSANSTAVVQSLENTKKGEPEKHVYSSIATREVIEEDQSGRSEATYMTMALELDGHGTKPWLGFGSQKVSAAPSVALAEIRFK